MEELSDLQRTFLYSGDVTDSMWKEQRRVLKAIHKYEYEREIFEFYEKEFEEIVKNIISSSEIDIGTAKYRLMYIRIYCKWINDNHKKIKFDYNKVLKQIENDLEDIINPILFNRDEIYEFVKKHKDPQLSMTLLLLFEGIKGNSYCPEILSLKRKNIIDNTVLIKDRKIIFPDDMMPIIDMGYRFEHGNGKQKYFMNEYLIHNANKSDIKDRKHWRTINNRLDRLKKEKAGLGLVPLEDSGMSFYLSLIENIKKEDPTDTDYYKVLKRYGKNFDDIDRLKRKYKLYKKSDKYDSNLDINKFERIFRNIMANEYEKNEQDKIKNPINELNIENQVSKIMDLVSEDIVVPTQFKIKIDMNLINLKIVNKWK